MMKEDAEASLKVCLLTAAELFEKNQQSSRKKNKTKITI